MRNIDLTSSYREIYKESQLDEAIPAIAGAIAKTAAKAAATTAATNMADKATKPKQTNEEVEELDEEGKKDACYHKVKSRYDVWPSAYASGALVKCRKKGAKNWGNSSKKEEVEYTEEGFNETYTAAYMEGYKKLPKHKMQDKAAMKPDTAKGEKQARKMDLVRNATDGNEDLVKSVTKGQEMSNRKRGLEKRYAMPSAKNAEQKKAKNAAYKLENQRRQDLNKRYGPKKEELEAVFATLIGEGIAHNEESAINIITHMSDEWYESIVEELLSEESYREKMRRQQKEKRERGGNTPDGEKVEIKSEPTKPVYNAEPKTTKVLKTAHKPGARWGMRRKMANPMPQKPGADGSENPGGKPAQG